VTVDGTRTAAVGDLPERVAFLGLGLIGGSIALALREAGHRGTLSAWSPTGRGPAEAHRRGIIDEAAASPEDALAGSELIVLACAPIAIIDHLESLAGAWRKRLGSDATITDVGSTKERIVERAGALGLPLVGGHPMAGRESTGVEAASADLFVDRPWVVVPAASARQADIDRVEGLATAAGAHPIRLAGEEHDVAVAAISHLPLVLSAALVETVAARTETGASWPLARELAAGGWRDMSRLARGDPEMGAGILATNAQPVADGLHAVRDAIDAWLEQLEAPEPLDAERLRRRLEAARAALEAEHE
jgi:prephenate dehydrogenase